MKTEHPLDSSIRQAVQCGDYRIDPAARRLLRNDAEVEVEGKVFDLILLLLDHRDRSLSKDELVDALWGHHAISDAALSQLVYKARRALGDNGERQAVIRTVFGHGMQWVAPITPVAGVNMASAPPAAAPPTNGKVTGSRRKRGLLAGTGILILLSILSLVLVQRSAAPPPTDLPRVAVLPMPNQTGEPTLDWSVQGLPALISSLLATTAGLNVIDPLEVTRVAGFTPSAGRSPDDHVRLVTRADILIHGQLRKLADHAYELDLQIERGGNTRKLNLSGLSPGTIAVSAMPPLRTALGLPPSPGNTGMGLPDDGYLAESFARGMGLADQGNWQDALPYFTLVYGGEPGFLPAAVRLGTAQAKTGQHDQAIATLQTAVSHATDANQSGLAAAAVLQLASSSLVRHQYAQALDQLAQAAPLAEQAGDVDMQAEVMLQSARAHARLQDTAAAAQDLQHAEKLINARTSLRLKASLANTRIFVADATDDAVAMESAARASMEANNAIGNQRGSFAALFNLGYALHAQGRALETIPVFNAVSRWARQQGDYPLDAYASYFLASVLSDTGLEQPAAELVEHLLAASRERGDTDTERLALGVQAELDWNTGDWEQAMRSMQAARQLGDPAENPADIIRDSLGMAAATVMIAPESTAAIVAQAKTLIARQPDPERHRFHAKLLDALAAAASGDMMAAHQALGQARAQGAGTPFERDDLHQVALLVATVGDDATAAAIALDDIDIATETSITTLGMAARWLQQHGPAGDHAQVLDRMAELRQTAARLLDTPVDTTEHPQ